MYRRQHHPLYLHLTTPPACVHLRILIGVVGSAESRHEQRAHESGQPDTGSADCFCCLTRFAVRSFDAAGGASAEANNEAVCLLAGIGGGDIFMAEWNNGVGRPCHYVAVDRASRQIVLSVRSDA
jgi:hypothetical protein